MDNVTNLSQAKLRELFSETAAIKGINNTIIEKDFWVTWVLNKIACANATSPGILI